MQSSNAIVHRRVSRKPQGYIEIIRSSTTWFNHTWSCNYYPGLRICLLIQSTGWATSGLLHSASFPQEALLNGVRELCSRSRWACLFHAHDALSSDSSVREDMDLIPTGKMSFFFCLSESMQPCVSPLQRTATLFTRSVTSCVSTEEATPVAFSLTVALRTVTACSRVHCDPLQFKRN